MTDPGPVLVAPAPNPAAAQLWVDMLRDQGIVAIMVETGIHAAFGSANLPATGYRVLVRPDDLLAARGVIAEAGGSGALAPMATASDGHVDQMIRRIGLALGIALAFLLVAAVVQAFAA